MSSVDCFKATNDPFLLDGRELLNLAGGKRLYDRSPFMLVV